MEYSVSLLIFFEYQFIYPCNQLPNEDSSIGLFEIFFRDLNQVKIDEMIIWKWVVGLNVDIGGTKGIRRISILKKVLVDKDDK